MCTAEILLGELTKSSLIKYFHINLIDTNEECFLLYFHVLIYCHHFIPITHSSYLD